MWTCKFCQCRIVHTFPTSHSHRTWRVAEYYCHSREYVTAEIHRRPSISPIYHPYITHAPAVSSLTLHSVNPIICLSSVTLRHFNMRFVHGLYSMHDGRPYRNTLPAPPEPLQPPNLCTIVRCYVVRRAYSVDVLTEPLATHVARWR